MSSPKNMQVRSDDKENAIPIPEKKHHGKKGHVLSDNSHLLRGINVNKMNHQYIQNLQKANMTLKCKIKEMAEMGPGSEVETFDSEPAIPRGSFDGGRWFNLEKPEEEVELKQLGTIEQLTAERFAAKKRRAEQSKDRRQRS